MINDQLAITDEIVKSRHSGENRSPGHLKPLGNTGFRLEFTPYLIRGRNDGNRTKGTFYETIKVDIP